QIAPGKALGLNGVILPEGAFHNDPSAAKSRPASHDPQRTVWQLLLYKAECVVQQWASFALPVKTNKEDLRISLRLLYPRWNRKSGRRVQYRDARGVDFAIVDQALGCPLRGGKYVRSTRERTTLEGLSRRESLTRHSRYSEMSGSSCLRDRHGRAHQVRT